MLAPMQPSLVDVRVARPRVVRSGHPRQKMKGSQGGQGRGPWRYAGGNGDRWPGSEPPSVALKAEAGAAATEELAGSREQGL